MSHEDVTLITSPVFQGLPVTHAFTTRLGGFGTGTCAGGNMHYRKGGLREEVRRNRENVFSAMGADLSGLRLVDQAHGGEVIVADGLTLEQTEQIPADGLVTTRPGITVGVYVADCLPILVASTRGVAALHGGWRSVIAGIIERGIETLTGRTGDAPSSLRMAVGAGIGPCCFEVGEEVAEAFRERDLHSFILTPPGSAKPHIDLPGAAREVALRAGLPAEQLWVSPHCTMCDGHLYYSYRRERWPTGQMMGLIGLRG